MRKSNYSSGKNERRYNPEATSRSKESSKNSTVFGDDMTWEYPRTHLTPFVEVIATERKREALNYAINLCLDHKYAVSSKILRSSVDKAKIWSDEEMEKAAAELGDTLKELEAVTRTLEQLFEIYDELF